MADPLNVDVAGATAALDAAGGFPDVIPTQGTEFNRDPNGRFAPNQPPAPEANAGTPAPSDPPAPPAEPAADTGTEVDFGQFTSIADEALTPEQLQMKRSLQADYTRKMQEAAPWRKLGEEIGVEDPAQVREMAQVYNQLQDPANWPTLHREISEYMQQFGMAPAAADQAATQQLEGLTPPVSPDGFDDYSDTPDFAPFAQKLTALEQQNQQLMQMLTQDRQQREEQTRMQTLAQGLTRMENAIRQQHPDYDDADIEAVYSFVGQDGDLFSAQQRYESALGHRLSKYIAGKQGVAATIPQPAPNAGIPAPQEPDTSGMDARDKAEAMHRAALAHVAVLEREAATS